MKDILIFGHKRPDTDSTTAAIALSYLKNKLGYSTKPMILDHINKETEFVLNYFNTPIPAYLEDVKLQIKDLSYYKNFYVLENKSIKYAYDFMYKNDITGVPIVDSNIKFRGLITSKMIGNELINGDFTTLNTSYENIIDVLKGVEVLKFDDEIIGNIVVAANKSTTILNNTIIDSNTVMIIGDRHSVIEAAVKNCAKLLIISCDSNIKEEHLLIAKENKVNVIKTSYDSYHAAKLINLCNYCKNLLGNCRNVSFKENDYYDDFQNKCSKLGYNNYPVVNNRGKCLGLIRLTDINKPNRKKVILVDHNEAQQSVEGLNEAEILEIIDHHKIGSITTSMPINFRNMTVGSTNTIIYSLFVENNVEIPSNIAGLMLSGILSDTLKFTSPTTTDYDKFVANNLAAISGVDINKYAKEMFRAASNLSGKTISEIIESDMKIFEKDNKIIAVSQIITMNSEDIINNKDKYINVINEMVNTKRFDMVVVCITDIIKNGSYILFNIGSKNILSQAFDLNEINEGHFLEGCLSRKKQLVPIILPIL